MLSRTNNTMLSKLKIKFYDLIILFFSFLTFLIIFSDFRKEFNARIVILFPKIPVVYFNNNNFSFEISNSNEKVFTPAFFNTTRFTEIDSRIAKFYNSNCDEARVYNFHMSYSMLTFTIDSHSKENVQNCFNQISDEFNGKWEDEKGNVIQFLSNSESLLTDFAEQLAKKVLDPLDYLVRNYKELDCAYFLNTFLTQEKVSKPTLASYIDVCGNKLKLNFAIQNQTDLSFKEKNSLNLMLSAYLKKNNIINFDFVDNHFYFPVFLNPQDGSSFKLDIKNINKRLLEIFKVYDEIYPNEVGFVWEGQNNYSNKKIENDQIMISMAIIQSYIAKVNPNQKKKTKVYTFEEFKESKLSILKSEIYELGSKRTFSSFGIYFTALFFSLMITLLTRITIAKLKDNFYEKK